MLQHFTRLGVTVWGIAKIFTTRASCARLACDVSLTFQPCQCINSWRISVPCFRSGWLRMPFEMVAGDQREQTTALFSLLWKEADQEIGHYSFSWAFVLSLNGSHYHGLGFTCSLLDSISSSAQETVEGHFDQARLWASWKGQQRNLFQHAQRNLTLGAANTYNFAKEKFTYVNAVVCCLNLIISCSNELFPKHLQHII